MKHREILYYSKLLVLSWLGKDWGQKTISFMNGVKVTCGFNMGFKNAGSRIIVS
jgi:hypothetical protein